MKNPNIDCSGWLATSVANPVFTRLTGMVYVFRSTRGAIVKRITEIGSKAWKIEAGYH
ncbi:MAG: hypothetical protein JKX71_06390 [Amylibacter sp.]|nr:hypothetical protein [Amylibacter sp.]